MDGENNGSKPNQNGWFGGKHPYFWKHPHTSTYLLARCCKILQDAENWFLEYPSGAETQSETIWCCRNLFFEGSVYQNLDTVPPNILSMFKTTKNQGPTILFHLSKKKTSVCFSSTHLERWKKSDLPDRTFLQHQLQWNPGTCMARGTLPLDKIYQ